MIMFTSVSSGVSDANSTGIELLMSYWGTVTSFWLDIVNLFNTNSAPAVTFELDLESLPAALRFSEFQWTLLRGFVVTLFVNLLLVCVAWRIYGAGICERFMKPATSKAIEELRASVSKLKLPKEHTPRI